MTDAFTLEESERVRQGGGVTELKSRSWTYKKFSFKEAKIRTGAREVTFVNCLHLAGRDRYVGLLESVYAAFCLCCGVFSCIVL